MGAGHVRRGPGLINEDQAIGIPVELAVEPRPAPPQDVRAVLLRGVGRLLFQVIWCRSKNRHSVPMPADTPAFASSARISLGVVSDRRSTRPRTSGACASMRAERRSPPSGPGATGPASRASAAQRIALDALTLNRVAAWQHDSPSAIAARTRDPRSGQRLRHAGRPPSPAQTLNQIAPVSGSLPDSIRANAARAFITARRTPNELQER